MAKKPILKHVHVQSLDHLRQVLREQWESRDMTMQWLAMEDCMRWVLEECEKKMISETLALGLLDQILGAYTRRGTCLSGSDHLADPDNRVS